VGAGRTLNGVTYQGASLSGPGHVVRSAPGPSRFGGEDGAFAERVAEAFESAGIEAEVVDDPFEAIWRKQLWGAAIKPTAALTRLSNGELVEHEGTRAVMRRLMEETASVAASQGVDLDADATFEVLCEGLAGSDHGSSRLQDVRAGRKTEIDDVNGANVALGSEAGVDVPVNEVVTALVRGMERGYLGGD
jgi:2-dehydropantoate 2-reductase